MNENETASLGAEETSNIDIPPKDEGTTRTSMLDANPAASPKLVKKLLDNALRLHKSGSLIKAAKAYFDVLRAAPETTIAWVNLGILNRAMGRYEPAVVCLRRGLSMDPKNANGWSSLGNALRALNRLEEAKLAQERGLSISPEFSQIHYNYGLVLHDLGMLNLALQAFTRAEVLGYDKPELLWDRSLTYLTKSDFKRGFDEYESRWKLKENIVHHITIPEWDGSPIENETLLVYAEQGQGDSLQFVRFLPLLAQKAKKVIFEAQPSIVSLLETDPTYKDIIILPRDNDAPAPNANVKMALLSAPKCLGIEDDLFSVAIPYLHPPLDGLHLRKPKGNALRVGLTWTGKPSHKNDRNRSIDLSKLSPLLDIPGIEFVSFQLGAAQKQITKQGMEPIIHDLSSHLDNFSVTASLLQDVDLLICVDTSIAHLAGAMGVPTWVLLPFTPDWRWQSGRADTPWYPSMTLFRQTSPGDWTELFHRVRESLKKQSKAFS